MNKVLKIMFNKYIFGFALIAFAQSAFAEWSLFTPSAQDQSVAYMSWIFNMPSVGVTGGEIPNVTAQTSPQWFSSLFQTFNWLIFTAGLFMVSYVGGVSLVSTAHEGEVMGKKYSAIWIPLRSAVGLIMLAPVPGAGYSLIQALVMWIVLNGIGAADTLWNVVADNLKVGSGALGPTSVKGAAKLQSYANQLAPSLLRAAVCSESINTYNASGKEQLKLQPEELPTISNNNSAIYSTTFSIGTPSDPDKAICGKYTVTTSLTAQEVQNITGAKAENISQQFLTDQANIIHKARVEAVNNMYGSLMDLAKSIVDQSLGPRDRSLPSLYSPSTQKSDGKGRLSKNVLDGAGILEGAKNTYVGALKSLTYTSCAPIGDLELPASCTTGANQQVQTNAKLGGWMTAAQYYQALNASQTATVWPAAAQEIQTTVPPPVWSFSKGDIPGYQTPTVVDFHDWGPKAANNPDSQDIKDIININFTKIINLLDYYGGPPTAATLPDFYNFVNVIYLLNDERVYEQHAGVGGGSGSKSNATQSYQGALTGANLPDEVSGEINNASGALSGLIGNFVQDIVQDLVRPDVDPILSLAQFGTNLMENSETAFWILLVALLIVAAAAGVVIPIPLTGPVYQFATFLQGLVVPLVLIGFSIAAALWTMGATLAVYIPLIPYMIYTMGVMAWYMLVIEAVVCAPIFALALVLPSDDDLGKLTNGIGLLGNIFLRPMFMVMGFLISVLVIRVVISFIANTIFTYWNSVLQGGGGSFVAIAELFVFEAIILAVINQGFTLIHILPDRAMRWIGGQEEGTRSYAEAGTGAAKEGSGKGTGMVQSGMMESGSTSGKLGGSLLDYAAQKNSDKNTEQNKDGKEGSGKGKGEGFERV